MKNSNSDKGDNNKAEEIRRQWQTAFAESSQAYWNGLFRFAMSLCYKEELAEDILQSTLLRATLYFEQFARKNFGCQQASDVSLALQLQEHQKHFRNWLYKIVRNVYLDDVAANSRLPVAGDETLLNSLAAESEADPLEPSFSGTEAILPLRLKAEEERFFYEAADDLLAKKMELLTDRQRSVLFLIAEDYSYKEAAAILGVPIGTIMSTLSRALAKLRN